MRFQQRGKSKDLRQGLITQLRQEDRSKYRAGATDMEAVHCLWTVLEEYKPCHVVGGLVLSSSHKHVLVARGLPSTTGLWYYCTLRLNVDNHCLFFSFNHFARTSPQHSFCLLSRTSYFDIVNTVTWEFSQHHCWHTTYQSTNYRPLSACKYNTVSQGCSKEIDGGGQARNTRFDWRGGVPQEKRRSSSGEF